MRQDTEWGRLVAALLAMDTGEFDENKHKRGGNPENKGQFSKGSGGGAKAVKAPKEEKKPKAPKAPIDVGAHISDLKANAGREGFKQVFEKIQSLDPASLKQIAHQFSGFKASSKKDAIAKIGQENLRILHSNAKAASALATNTWGGFSNPVTAAMATEATSYLEQLKAGGSASTPKPKASPKAERPPMPKAERKPTRKQQLLAKAKELGIPVKSSAPVYELVQKVEMPPLRNEAEKLGIRTTTYESPEWLEDKIEAVKEANRLGIKLDMNVTDARQLIVDLYKAKYGNAPSVNDFRRERETLRNGRQTAAPEVAKQ